jgi:hypothetical protein
MMWCIRVVQGRLTELRPLFRAGIELLPVRAVWTYVSEAQLEWEAGHSAAAHAALVQAFEHGLLEQPSGAAWAPTLQWAADICAGLDDGALAAPLYEILEPHGGTMTVTVGPMDHALGRLALTLGNRDDAERRLRQAVEVCERMDARAYLAVVHHDLGDLLLPSDEGRRLLERAHSVAAELGMRSLASRSGRGHRVTVEHVDPRPGI